MIKLSVEVPTAVADWKGAQSNIETRNHRLGLSLHHWRHIIRLLLLFTTTHWSRVMFHQWGHVLSSVWFLFWYSHQIQSNASQRFISGPPCPLFILLEAIIYTRPRLIPDKVGTAKGHGRGRKDIVVPKLISKTTNYNIFLEMLSNLCRSQTSTRA